MSKFNQPAAPADPPDTSDPTGAAAGTSTGTAPPTNEQLDAMTQQQLVELGGQMDHVTVLSQVYPFTAGSKAEKKAERQVSLCFTLGAVFALAFVVIFIVWPWNVTDVSTPTTSTLASFYTPLLGVTLGAALLFLGAGLVLWAKKLMPHEVSVQERHEGASSEADRRATAATMLSGVEVIGITRRSAIRRSLLGAGAILGLATIIPLGGLIKSPYANRELWHTSWRKGIRLTRLNGTPIKPSDMEPGGLETVFPAVPGGDTQADAATMLIRLHNDQAEAFTPRPMNEGFRWNQYVAFSKICSHLGCPVSLYEQETGRILCPCHQSQFDITKDAAPIFGPAARSLPQLPIELDDEGYFVARSDYHEPVGPAFWDRAIKQPKS